MYSVPVYGVMYGACGVNDTACTMNVGGHWHRMQNMTPNALNNQQTIRAALAAFKENTGIYQKHICSRVGLPQHYENI
jgi:hypothetical protein